jgi:hypothetical protein
VSIVKKLVERALMDRNGTYNTAKKKKNDYLRKTFKLFRTHIIIILLFLI